jgi:hypothetical protein
LATDIRHTDTRRHAAWKLALPSLIFGAVLGYFAWHAFYAYTPHRYRVGWSEARWLTPGNGSPQAYFRGELYAPDTPRDAWVYVSATDGYTLTLNGDAVGGNTFVSLNASGVHDLTRMLRHGKNVIGVSVHRSSYPGAASVLVEGAYIDQGGRTIRFASDDGWRTASFERRQGDNRWDSVDFDASSWPVADAGGGAEPGRTHTIAHEPLGIASAPEGKWIWHPDMRVRESAFIKVFNLNGRVKDGWIRIAADRSYDLTVNDAGVAGNRLFESGLHVYDIAPYLRRGENSIVIRVSAPYAPRGLLADGRIEAERAPSVDLSTSSSAWRVLVASGAEDNLPPRDDPRWVAASEIGTYLSAQWGPLAKQIRGTDPPLAHQAAGYVKMTLFILAVMSIAVVCWLASAYVYGLVNAASLPDALSTCAVSYIPPILMLSFIYILRYDVRYDPAFPFQRITVIAAVAAVMALQTVLTLAEAFHRGRRSGKAPEEGRRVAEGGAVSARNCAYAFAFVVLALTAAGFVLRVQDLGFHSLTGDEIGTVQQAQGVMVRGYPYKEIGGIDKAAATYELLSYPVALVVYLFGLSDFTVRLPAAVFGAATIPLIYLFASRVFDRRVGLLASAIYAFSPWAVYWSRNLRYPQQAQLTALLTAYFFYKAMGGNVDEPSRGSPLAAGVSEGTKPGTGVERVPLYLAAFFYITTYLTWEGSGFFLGALSLGLIAVKGRDIRWMRDPHVWIAGAIIIVVVYLQLSRRMLLGVPYIVVGSGLSDASITAFFLNPMYDPYFYMVNGLWVENVVVLTVVAALGVPLLFKDARLRYVYVLWVAVIFMMTNLYSNPANRYIYYVFPFMVTSVSAVCIRYADRAAVLGMSAASSAAYGIRRLSVFLAPLMLVAASNTIVLKLYNLSNSPGSPVASTRLNVYEVDYRSTDRFLKERLRKDDAIISVMPHTSKFYIGRTSYFLQTYTDRQVVYDVAGSGRRYIDKYDGTPVLRNVDDLRQVFGSHDRIWVVAAPYNMLVFINDAGVVDYIKDNATLVYESYKSKLYLWERRRLGVPGSLEGHGAGGGG